MGRVHLLQCHVLHAVFLRLIAHPVHAVVDISAHLLVAGLIIEDLLRYAVDKVAHVGTDGGRNPHVFVEPAVHIVIADAGILVGKTGGVIGGVVGIHHHDFHAVLGLLLVDGVDPVIVDALGGQQRLDLQIGHAFHIAHAQLPDHPRPLRGGHPAL